MPIICTNLGKALTWLRFAVLLDRGWSSIRLSAPLGTEAAHDFAMDHRRTQGAFAGVVIGRHLVALQEDEERMAIFSIPLEYVAPNTAEPSFQQLHQMFLGDRDLSLEASLSQVLSAISQANGVAEQGLPFLALPFLTGRWVKSDQNV